MSTRRVEELALSPQPHGVLMSKRTVMATFRETELFREPGEGTRPYDEVFHRRQVVHRLGTKIPALGGIRVTVGVVRTAGAPDEGRTHGRVDRAPRAGAVQGGTRWRRRRGGRRWRRRRGRRPADRH